MINFAQARRILELTLAEYSGIRAGYYAQVFDLVKNYLISKAAVTSYTRSMKRAMSDAFVQVAEIAWVDGGSDLPLDGDALDWLSARQSAEFGFIDELFQRLKMLRGEETKDTITDTANEEAASRAEGYAGTLDLVYSTIKLLAGKNKMLTFVGTDGKESCKDCRKYKNKRHKASWWVAHDAIPGSHTGFECGGWLCQHILIDDGGQVWTL